MTAVRDYVIRAALCAVPMTAAVEECSDVAKLPIYSSGLDMGIQHFQLSMDGAIFAIYKSPVFGAVHEPRFVNSDESIFSGLVASWHRERGISSSITRITATDAYLKIIGMGQRALPLILKQLKAEGEKPDHWFVALHAITNENPVSPEIRGNMKAMANAWLAWADNKYVG